MQRGGDSTRVALIDRDINWFHPLYHDPPPENLPPPPESVVVRSYHTSDSRGEYPVLYDRLLKAAAKAVGVARPEEIAFVVEMLHKRLASRRRSSVA